MLTLNEQLNHEQGTFFCVLPSGATRVKIEDLVASCKIENGKNPLKYHTTVIYSEKPCPKMRFFDPVLPIWGVAYGFDKFGPNGDVLVLRIKSESLNKLYDTLSQGYGAESKYPEYKAHMTIAENYTGEIPVWKEDIVIKYDSFVCCAINKEG